MSSVAVWCKPVITPSGPHIVVPKLGKLELRCTDNATTSGAPSRLRWLRERVRRVDGEVEEGRVTYIKVSPVQPLHMGRYVCINNSTRERSSIYVYVKGGCMRPWRRDVQLLVCPSAYINQRKSSVFHLLRPSTCFPVYHGKRHPGTRRWKLHHPLSCDWPRPHPPGFGNLRWKIFALGYEVS